MGHSWTSKKPILYRNRLLLLLTSLITVPHRFRAYSAPLLCRTPRNFSHSCWFKASSPWDVPWAAVCTFSTKRRPTAGFVCCWQLHSAGSCLDRPHSCCAMSWLCSNSTARSATAASASASSHQATACCPCCAGPWSLLSLWLWWLPYQSSISTSSLQQRPSDSGHHWLSATHCWWCTCKVGNM